MDSLSQFYDFHHGVDHQANGEREREREVIWTKPHPLERLEAIEIQPSRGSHVAIQPGSPPWQAPFPETAKPPQKTIENHPNSLSLSLSRSSVSNPYIMHALYIA